MAKVRSQGPVKMRVVKMREAKKSEAYFAKKAMALIDEIMDSRMTTGAVIRSLFGISHAFLDVGEWALHKTMRNHEEEEGA